MSMPKIPDRPNITICDTVVDLLESIALEEIALSHILNAQGEKIQAVVKQFCENNICHCQLESSCKETTKILNSIIMKEWLLFVKMQSVIELNEIFLPKVKEEHCCN